MLLNDGEQFKIHHGDCITHMLEEMPPESVDLSIQSPPFPSLYAYGSDPGDIGNTDTVGDEAKLHLSFFYRGLARVLKPGRVAIVHVTQIPRMKRSGEVGLCDFRGLNIRLGERAGLVYEYDWLCRRNPQAQAIRTRSRELQFSGLESDRAKSRGTLCDYLIKFRAMGDNAIPIRDYEYDLNEEGERIGQHRVHESQVSRNDWINYAEGAWFDINETRTLNVKYTKGESDTKHICPLQLDIIERCIRLYSNPGEIVFSAFGGIGSEPYSAIKLGRRGYACELKSEYFAAANKNCNEAVDSMRRLTSQKGLFDDSGTTNGRSVEHWNKVRWSGIMADGPLKWHGGKHYLASKIRELMPKHVHYVEPYFGGGSVLLSGTGEGVSEVVNDICGNLTNFWRVLQSSGMFEEFRRVVEATPFSEPEFHKAESRLEVSSDTVMRAAQFFVVNRQSRQGLMKDFATLSRNRTRRGMNEQASAWLSSVDGLPEVHARLKRVVILNSTATKVIQQQDGPNTFFYLDPPYLHQTRSTTGEYQHEMTEADHVELLMTLGKLEGKFILSGYPSEMYADAAELYGWRVHDFELPNNASSKSTKDRKTERLWMNYRLDNIA